MTKVQDIYAWLDAAAPFSTQMDFDNAGLLVGSADAPVSTVLLTLDITNAVVAEAKKLGAELIISHHPVIFHPLKQLSSESVPYQLAVAGISAICAHTNLDMAPDGVNVCLAKQLGLTDVQPFAWYQQSPEGLIGTVEEYTPDAFAAFVRMRLDAVGLVYTEGTRPVRRVALCGGAGEELLFQAISGGADAFVTGESKHHLLLAARENGITMIAAGHYATERVVLPTLQKQLQQAFPALHVNLSAADTNPVRSAENK